eukprot:403356080
MSTMKIAKYGQNVPQPIPFNLISNNNNSMMINKNVQNINNNGHGSQQNKNQNSHSKPKRMQSDQARISYGNQTAGIFQFKGTNKKKQGNTNLHNYNGDADISRQSVVIQNEYATQGSGLVNLANNKNATAPYFMQNRQKSAQNPQRKQDHQAIVDKSQPADLLKLFGNERNFQLIKSLMDSSQVQTTQNKKVNNRNKPKIQNQLSQRVLGMENQLIEDKEIKVEKAILDLNELKTQMFTEKQSQNALAAKDQFRKSNYSNFQQTSYSTQSAFTNKLGPVKALDNNTSSSFYQAQNNQNNISHISNNSASTMYNNPPQIISKNLTNHNFGQNTLQQQQKLNALPSVTQTSFFSNQTSFNFNKAGSLTTNIEQMDKEQLKERLLVAETIMKKLYNRNKELEESQQQNYAQSSATQQDFNILPKISNDQETGLTKPLENIAEQDKTIDIGLLEQLKKREDDLIKELESKQKEIDDLKDQNLENLKKLSENKANTYSFFLEERLAECQLENRRILLKYQEMRNFAYQQIEQHIKQLNKKKNNNIQNNNLTVYKQMIERERKHWQYEIEQKNQQISKQQFTVKEQESSISEMKERLKELEEEIETRETCEAKVQEYVKTLVEKNESLNKQIKQQQ